MKPSTVQLQTLAQDLVENSIRPSTKRTYTSAQRHFLQFCEFYNFEAVPCNSETVVMYVAYLNCNGFKLSSIRVYLSAIRSLHLCGGFQNPFEGSVRLKMALRSIAINGGAPKQKLPITIEMLQKIFPLLDGSPNSKLLWAAMTLGHFGLLRASEFTVPSQGGFDPKLHLQKGDIEFTTLDNGQECMRVFIKTSKTDKFRNGVNLYLGCSQFTVCALCAMKDYLGPNIGNSDLGSPLFKFSNGALLTRHLLLQQTHLYLTLLGISCDSYSGHSYRIGGATSMASAGMTDWEIKLGGRWSSDVYQRYIRVPPSMLASFAKRMVPSPSFNRQFLPRNPYINNLFNSGP